MTDFSIIFAEGKREFSMISRMLFCLGVGLKKLHLRILKVNLGLGENSENINISCQQKFSSKAK